MLIRLLLVYTLFAVGVASAATSWKDINHAIIVEHVVPRYQQLADAGELLEKRASNLCISPSEGTFSQVRKSFYQVMDSWMNVQHIRMGSVELFDRYHRFQLWPDKHNTGNRQIARLLAVEDSEVLVPDSFSRTSVAVQGLTALEQLLFSRTEGVTSFVKDGKANYRCQLVEAIAHNVASMSQELAKEWRTKPPYEMLFISAGGMTYELKIEKDIAGRREIAMGFYNNMYTQVQSLIDQKLLRPLGPNEKKAKPRYLESWRSQRSLRNVTINLQALESLYDIGFAALLKTKKNGLALDKELKLLFRNSQKEASMIEPPLYDALKKKGERARVENLVVELRKLQNLLTGPLAQALEVSLGFNALDGD